MSVGKKKSREGDRKYIRTVLCSTTCGESAKLGVARQSVYGWEDHILGLQAMATARVPLFPLERKRTRKTRA